VVSIPACHAGDPGSIPGLGVTFSILSPAGQTTQFCSRPGLFSQVLPFSFDSTSPGVFVPRGGGEGETIGVTKNTTVTYPLPNIKKGSTGT
jgi:hypothetical protein